MNIKKILQLSVKNKIISENQKVELIQFFEEYDNETNSDSSVTKIMYYIGGFIMLCAMFSLMLHTIHNSTYFIILWLGLFYALIFIGTGEYLWKRKEKFPAGILYFLFITMFSLIILDFEKMIGFFPHFSDMYKIDNYYSLCRVPVLVLSGVGLWMTTFIQKYRKTDIFAIPIIFFLYSIFLTILHYIYNDSIFKSLYLASSGLIFSIGLLVIGLIKDKITRVDYSKWMYFFSAIGIYLNLFIILDNYNQEIVSNSFLGLSLLYCFIGLILQRKLFSIIGLIGIIKYIICLEFDIIDSDNPILLTSVILITGMLILLAGVWVNKYSTRIRNKFIRIITHIISNK